MQTTDELLDEAMALARESVTEHAKTLNRTVPLVFALGVMVGVCLTIIVGHMLGAF